jgi:hypothetical protein
LALPQILDVTTPAGADSPSQGDDRIRETKQFLSDVFGITSGASYGTAAFSITTAGVVTLTEASVPLATAIQGGYKVVGATGINNSSDPDHDFDLDADIITLRNTNGYTITRYNPGAAITNVIDASQSGSEANKRDQASAFSDPSFIHFYWIWNGTTLATLSSATAPTTGPTLPSGYTHWAYACTIYFTGGVLRRTFMHGSWVWILPPVQVLSSGGATTPTLVSVSTVVPANALHFRMYTDQIQVTADGSAIITANAEIGVNNTVDEVINLSLNTGGLVAGTASDFALGGQFTIPNIGQAFYYDWNISAGSDPRLTLKVVAYQVPNGSE